MAASPPRHVSTGEPPRWQITIFNNNAFYLLLPGLEALTIHNTKPRLNTSTPLVDRAVTSPMYDQAGRHPCALSAPCIFRTDCLHPAEQPPPCRRLNRFRGATTGLLALARRREDLKHSQVAARENRVTLFRRYRTGELPDIQRVTVAAFLGPLGTLMHAPVASCLS